MSRTGSIRRSGRTWGFVLDIGRANGRRQRVRKRGFRTRKDAQTALNDALAELQHGDYVRPRRITLESYLDDWLASLAIAGRRPTTIAGYRRLIRVHVNPTLGHLELQQITAVDVDRFYAQLAAAGSPGGRGALSKSTIRKAHVLIGKALGDAERKGRNLLTRPWCQRFIRCTRLLMTCSRSSSPGWATTTCAASDWIGTCSMPQLAD